MEEYIGVIKFFAGTFAPVGYQFCQGQLLNVAQNTALFSILGATYGGNGSQTFGLPNFSGRAPVGPGQLAGGATYVLGQMGGAENAALNGTNLPAHTHAATATSVLYAEGDDANQPLPEGNLLGNTASNLYVTPSGSDNVKMSDQAVGTTVTIQPTGSSQPFSILSPFLGMNYIICVQGLYPTRP